MAALRPDLQQPTQSRLAGRVPVDGARVLAVLLERGALADRVIGAAVAVQRGAYVSVGCTHRMLGEGDRLRVPHVVLAVATPRVDAADRQKRVVRSRVGAGVPLERLGGEHVQPHAPDAGGGTGEMGVDQLALEAHGLEDLRAAIGLDRGDAHLRDRLEQAFADRFDEVLRRLLQQLVQLLGVGRPLAAVLRGPGDSPLDYELVERLERQVGVDGARAIADQGREVVHLTRLARLEDDARPQARALDHEMVVDGGDREQRGNRHPAGPDRAVGEDDDVDARRDRLVRFAADPLDRPAHAGCALLGGPGDVERQRFVHVVLDVAKRLELAVEQDRLVEQELVRVLGGLLEQVALVAEARREAHHDLLADRVDRRVGHLREQLLEVREQRRLAV